MSVIIPASGTGDATPTVATDSVGGAHHQRVKFSVGAAGAASDAIPVSDGLDTTAAGVQAAGLVAQFDDVAPSVPTENQFAALRLSSRRALRVEGVSGGDAVPISAASLPLPTGAATLAEQQTQSASLSVLDDWDEADRAKVNPIAGQAGVAAGAGAVNALTQRVTLASDDPAVAALNPRTSGGYSLFHRVATADANAASVKASAGQVYVVSIFNKADYPVYLKLHNTAGVPTAGAGVVSTIGVQAGLDRTVTFPHGLPFGTGIGITIVKDLADAGATAVAAEDCVVDVAYT